MLFLSLLAFALISPVLAHASTCLFPSFAGSAQFVLDHLRAEAFPAFTDLWEKTMAGAPVNASDEQLAALANKVCPNSIEHKTGWRSQAVPDPVQSDLFIAFSPLNPEYDINV